MFLQSLFLYIPAVQKDTCTTLYSNMYAIVYLLKGLNIFFLGGGVVLHFIYVR